MPQTNSPQTSINNPLNPSGVGLVNFFGESQSRLYPHMRAKFGRGRTVVSKKGSLKFISRPSQSRLYPHMRAKFGRGRTVVSKKGSLKFISRPSLYCIALYCIVLYCIVLEVTVS